MKLPTKHSGVTGDNSRGSEDTACRLPSVKASLSVSFGQRAPYHASTRGSSPIRRTLPPPAHDRERDRDWDQERVRDRDRDQERVGDRDRESDLDRYRERDRDRDMERERDREKGKEHERDRDSRKDDYKRRSRERSKRDGRSQSRSKSRSRSRSIQTYSARHEHENGSKEKASASSNLAKLRDTYGDLSTKKENESKDRVLGRDSGGEEVIKLGGSTWR